MSSTLEKFKTRQEILESDLPVYDKSLALKAWDSEHAGQPPEPPHLNPREREQLADFGAKIRALKGAHVALASNLEKYRQGQDKTRTEIKRLEQTLEPDDAEGIRSLIFMRCRLEILDRYVNTAPKRLAEIETAAQSCFFHVDSIITKRFGPDLGAGGRLFANAGMGGSLPVRCDAALAAIENVLQQ